MVAGKGSALYTAFLQEQFYRNKSLDFGKKFKNKLRTKPGHTASPTEHKNKVPRLAILKIIKIKTSEQSLAFT